MASAAAFPGVKVANRGISGDTTRGVLIRLQEDVLALDPAASSCSSAPTTSRKARRPETSPATCG